jgi:hypothetical protein
MPNFEQIIGACIAVIVAGLPAVLALLKINSLHVMVNSRITELLETTRRLAKAEGILEERSRLERERKESAPCNT